MAIEIRSPKSAFIKVDFPTFGLPTIFTKPALCIVIKKRPLNSDSDHLAGDVSICQENVHGTYIQWSNDINYFVLLPLHAAFRHNPTSDKGSQK